MWSCFYNAPQSPDPWRGWWKKEGKSQKWEMKKRGREKRKARMKRKGKKTGVDFYFIRAQLELGRRLAKAGPAG